MAQNHIPASSAHATGIQSDAGLDPGNRPQEQPHRNPLSNLLQATLGRIANFHADRYANAMSAAIVGNPGRPLGHPTELLGEPAIDHRMFLAGVMSYARGAISGQEGVLSDALRQMQDSRLQPPVQPPGRPEPRPEFQGGSEGGHTSMNDARERFEDRSRTSEFPGRSAAHYHRAQGSDLEAWARDVAPADAEETPSEPREEREDAHSLPQRHRPATSQRRPAPGEPGWTQPEPTDEERDAAQQIYQNFRAQGVRNSAQLVGVTAGSGQHHPRTRNQFLPAPREVEHHHHTTHSHDGDGDGDGDGDDGPYEDDQGNT